MTTILALMLCESLAKLTLPNTTMPVEKLSVDLTGEGETALSTFLHHCFLGNVFGIPALSFPCGFSSDGLPIGLQVLGKHFDESTVFRIGHAVEHAMALKS